MKTDVIVRQPIQTDFRLRRKELKLEDKRLLLETARTSIDAAKDIAVTILSNPAIIYIGSYLFVRYLQEPKWSEPDADGKKTLIRNGIISGDIGDKLRNNLEAAFIAGTIASAASKIVGVFKP